MQLLEKKLRGASLLKIQPWQPPDFILYRGMYWARASWLPVTNFISLPSAAVERAKMISIIMPTLPKKMQSLHFSATLTIAWPRPAAKNFQKQDFITTGAKCLKRNIKILMLYRLLYPITTMPLWDWVQCNSANIYIFKNH